MDHKVHLKIIVVGEGVKGFGTTATLSTRRALCRCFPGLTRTTWVAKLYFRDETTSFAAPIDIRWLSKMRSDSQTRLQVKLRIKGGKDIVASCGLQTFLSDLTQHGFVELWKKGVVIMRLVTIDQDSVSVFSCAEATTLDAQSTEKKDSMLTEEDGLVQDKSDCQTQITEVQSTDKPKRKRRRRQRKSAVAKKNISTDKDVTGLKETKNGVKVQKNNKVKSDSAQKESKDMLVREGVSYAAIVKSQPSQRKAVTQKTREPTQPVTWVIMNVPPECRGCTRKLMKELHLQERFPAVNVSVPHVNAPAKCPVVIKGPLADVRVVRAELMSCLGMTDKRQQQRKQKKQKQRTSRPRPQEVTLGCYVKMALTLANPDKQRQKKRRRQSQQRQGKASG